MYTVGSLQGTYTVIFSFCSFPRCPLLLHHLADLCREHYGAGRGVDEAAGAGVRHLGD